MFGTFFLLAQYLQGVLGYSPLGAAVRLLPISVVMMAVAPHTPKLVARFGADKVGMAGLLLVAAGLVGIALFQTDTSYPQLVAHDVRPRRRHGADDDADDDAADGRGAPRPGRDGLGDQRHDPRARRRARRRRARLAARQPVHVGRRSAAAELPAAGPRGRRGRASAASSG